MIEEWLPVVGLESWLDVSNLGRIRTKENADPTGRVWPGCILSQGQNPCGYLFVRPRIRGSRRNISVHRSVAAAFIGSSNGLEVNHKNGIKTDNRAENLEYVTRSENIRHALKLGLAKMPKNGGVRTKLTEEEFQQIVAIGRSLPQRTLAKMFNVSGGVIVNIRRGIRPRMLEKAH